MYKDTDIKGQTANKVQFLSSLKKTVISMKEMSPFKFLLSTRNRISTTNQGISQRKKISFKPKLKEKKIPDLTFHIQDHTHKTTCKVPNTSFY